MVRAILLAGLLALVLPAYAVAQEHHDDHRGPPPRGPGGPPPQRNVMPQHSQGPVNPGLNRSRAVPGPNLHQGPVVGPNLHQGPVVGPNFHQGPVVGGPHLGPAGHTQFTYHGHGFNPVHVSPFIYPQGWAYRRWAVGAVLPPLFLAPAYYYTDWAALGLDPPPPGTQWVRYGPDMLLVDVGTGNVIEVVPDVFYE